jgi:hypothetical protein
MNVKQKFILTRHGHRFLILEVLRLPRYDRDGILKEIPGSRFPESQKEAQIEFKLNAILQIPGIFHDIE